MQRSLADNPNIIYLFVPIGETCIPIVVESKEWMVMNKILTS
jgi:hypothetical protein